MIYKIYNNLQDLQDLQYDDYKNSPWIYLITEKLL